MRFARISITNSERISERITFVGKVYVAFYILHALLVRLVVFEAVTAIANNPKLNHSINSALLVNSPSCLHYFTKRPKYVASIVYKKD